MKKNKRILEYIEDMIYLKHNNEQEALKVLQHEGRTEYVTLEDVGFALMDIVDDLANHVDTSQALTEMRMRAIVYSLPDDIQGKIYEAFDEAEDDLFTNIESEETINDTEESNEN
jgi:hypothetical protein